MLSLYIHEVIKKESSALKPVRIFRHDDRIEAGYFAETLERINLSYELVAIDQGDPVLADVRNISGLAFLGGTMSVNDSFTWINDELNLICSAAEKKLPVLGHCFGAQLMSKALGGKISSMPRKEIGWYTIKFLDNEVSKQWFSQLPQTVDAMLWHEDAMTIPQGAVPLYATAFNPYQGFTIDNMIATIPHVEVTATMLSSWLEVYGHDLTPLSASVQSVEEVSKNLNERVSAMQQLTDVLYDRWLGMVVRYNQK